MKKIICKKRYIPLLITCLIPSFIYAHAGIYDRYLSALPAYYALTSIPSGIFYGMHGLLLIGTVIYFLLHKFRDYNLPCIKMPRYAIHENVKLLITTILLSLVLTPVLFINKSFFGTVIVVIFVLSIIYFIAILFSKIRTLLVSKAYTCFLIATLALQSIYYACYYTFSLWENVTIKEWFKIVDEMVPGYPTTLYPEFVIPITELLMNILALSFFFIVPYLIYLLVYLCRFLISKKKQS